MKRIYLAIKFLFLWFCFLSLGFDYFINLHWAFITFASCVLAMILTYDAEAMKK